MLLFIVWQKLKKQKQSKTTKRPGEADFVAAGERKTNVKSLKVAGADHTKEVPAHSPVFGDVFWEHNQELEVNKKVRCYNEPADVVFVLDGSRSVRPENFQKILNFTRSLIESLTVGSTETRIGVVQYSSYVETEIRLDEYFDKESLISALMKLEYHELGTVTGEAIQHTLVNVFSEENGARKVNFGVRRVMILISDGIWSTVGGIEQAVNDANAAGIERFAVGIGNAIRKEDLEHFVSEPIDSHLYLADDFDILESIQPQLMRKVCNEDVCGTGNIDDDVQGFDILGLMDISSSSGITTTNGSNSNYTAYNVGAQSDIRVSPASLLFPLGLPQYYSIISTFRMTEITEKQHWVLLEIRDGFGGVYESVRIVGGDARAVEYVTIDETGRTQTLVFEGADRLFEEGFHKLAIFVTPGDIRLHIDCKEIGRLSLLSPRGLVRTDGEIVIAKRLSDDAAVLVDLQQLELICDIDPNISKRFFCCELEYVKDTRCASVIMQMLTSHQRVSSETRYEFPLYRQRVTPDEDENDGKENEEKPRGYGLQKLDGAMFGIPEKENKNKTFEESGEPRTVDGSERGRLIESSGPDKIVDANPIESPPPDAPNTTSPTPSEKCECENKLVIGPKGEVGQVGVDGDQGQKGAKGKQGPRGPKGERGAKGETGDIGEPGLPGPVGLDGLTGAVGVKGVKGKKGANGEKGDSGPAGLDGDGGQKGAKGEPCKPDKLFDGMKGAKGEKGSKGERGPVGKQGTRGRDSFKPGHKGYRGEKGASGTRGLPGKPGRPGEQGPPGKIGEIGLPGESGIKGQKGEQGVPGMQGPMGHHGDAGSQGPKGHRGPPGRTGPDGLRGLPGAKGHHGEKGDTGYQGEVGKQGPPGPAGPQGEDGEFGPPGPPGTPGTPGPRGPKGTKGDVGPAGEKGTKGDAGEKGDQGDKGDAGLDGERGPPRDMEEIMKVIKQTISEMLPVYMTTIQQECQRCVPKRALPGTPGPPGEQGITGKPGERGLPGEEGSRGYPGGQGPPGETGKQGEKGDKGDKGDQGKSLPGPMGPVGPPGKPGAPGKAFHGKKGDAGSRGYPGRRGVRGPAGMEGVPGVCEPLDCNSGLPAVRPDPLVDESRKGPYPTVPPPDNLVERPGNAPGELLTRLRIPPGMLRELKGPGGQARLHIPGYRGGDTRSGRHRLE